MLALQRQLEEQRAAAAGLAAENRRLEQAATTGEGAALQAIREELSATTNELGALWAEKAVLEQRLAGAAGGDSRLTAELEQLRNQLQAVERKYAQIQSELAAAAKIATAHTTDLERTRLALTQAEQRATEVARELQTHGQTRGEENSRLSADLTQAQLQLGELQGQVIAARRETEEVRGQLQAAQGDAAGQLNRMKIELETAQQKWAAADQAGQKLASSQAALTAQVETMQRENRGLRTARAAAEDTSGRVKSLESTLAETRQTATLEQQRLTRDLTEAQALLTRTERSQSELQQQNQRLSEEQQQLVQANQRLTANAALPPPSDGTATKLAEQLDAAARTLERKDQTIATLNGRVESLRQDMEVSQQAVAAALAAQANAARAMPDITAINLEIETLRDQLRQRETQLETDQKNAAVELARLADQVQLSRQANRALADANRALLSSQSSADAMTSEEEQRLNARVRELSISADKLAQERNEFRAQVEEILPRLTAAEQDVARFRREAETTRAQAVSSQAELSALQGRFTELDRAADTQGSSVAELTGLNDRLTREKQTLQTQLTQTQRQAEQAQTDASLLRTRLEASERLGEIQKAGVADLTSTNEKLEEQAKTLNVQLAQVGSSANRALELQTANQELEENRAALRRQLDDLTGQVATLRAENSRLAQADQWRAEAESRAASLAGLTSQLTSAQRDIAALRAENARLNENVQLVERDRQNRVVALQQENAAIGARLRQAQSTLEQIASAARLINPAAGGSGGVVPTVRPTVAETPSSAARVHTVVDGDSLSRISLRYFGTPNRWQEIYDANREALAGANVLRPGQQLRIP